MRQVYYGNYNSVPETFSDAWSKLIKLITWVPQCCKPFGDRSAVVSIAHAHCNFQDCFNLSLL